MREVERRGETPRERLLAIFDVLGEWFETDDFAGCLFIKASAEYIDAGSAIRREIAEHKRLVLDYILELVTLAGAARSCRGGGANNDPRGRRDRCRPYRRRR